MILKKITQKFVIAFSLAIALVSCTKDGKEGGDSPLTKDEAKQLIDQTTDNFYNCLKNLNDGGFSNFFYNGFFVVAETRTITYTYGDPSYGYYGYTRTEKDSWIEILGEAFEEQYGELFGDSFEYQALKGVYTWNSSTKEWVRTAGNDITLHFPADKDATTNNAKLVLNNYQDQSFDVEGRTIKLPKKGNLSVTIDGTKVFGIQVNDVVYHQHSTDVIIPKKADVQIYANPFMATLKWNEIRENSFGLDFVFSSPNSCTTSLKGEVKLTHTDFENINPEKDIEKVNLEVAHNELRVIFIADVKGINNTGKEIDDMSAEEINSFVKAEVFKNLQKAADLKIEKDNAGKMIPYLIFEDGSKEKAENFVSDFPEKIENIFRKFIE